MTDIPKSAIKKFIKNAEQLAWGRRDAILFGTGFVMISDNGFYKRLDPRVVFVNKKTRTTKKKK
jgi:hypothetical protein